MQEKLNKKDAKDSSTGPDMTSFYRNLLTNDLAKEVPCYCCTVVGSCVVPCHMLHCWLMCRALLLLHCWLVCRALHCSLVCRALLLLALVPSHQP